jgi:iron-sulfur cluster insertion protein
MSEIVRLSDQAATKVWELIQEEANPHLKLRVYIEGGGCSGFLYKFALEEARADDTKISYPVPGGIVEILIDPLSYTFLIGAEIDYKEDIEGSEFIIRNPNASTTCGCGSSFSV